jgi:circadian clock protein KaiC
VLPIVIDINLEKTEKKGDDRVLTGIDGFDRMLSGGFFPKTVNLITGTSGAGKTTFCTSFLYYGAKKFGEKGAYITFEEGKDQIIRDSKNSGINLEEMKDMVTIFDIAGLRKAYTMKEEIAGDYSYLDIDILIDLIKRNCKDVKRIVVDSVVPLSMKYPDINEFRASLYRLRQTLKDMDATSLISTEIPISSNDISRFGFEDFLADSVTVLKMTEAGRKIKIHKLRGSNHYKDYVDYKITEQGIEVYV